MWVVGDQFSPSFLSPSKYPNRLYSAVSFQIKDMISWVHNPALEIAPRKARYYFKHYKAYVLCPVTQYQNLVLIRWFCCCNLKKKILIILSCSPGVLACCGFCRIMPSTQASGDCVAPVNVWILPEWQGGRFLSWQLHIFLVMNYLKVSTEYQKFIKP